MSRKLFFIAVVFLLIFTTACSEKTVAVTATNEPVEAETQKPSDKPTKESSKAPEDTKAPVEAETQKPEWTIDDRPMVNIVYEETFKISMPYDSLSDKLLTQINADGFSGTDAEIMQSILDWQAEYMFYIGNPEIQSDISYPMRWNCMIPGIYPVSQMVTERVLDNGKIYGLCWDYAAIFNAISNSYGLETRVSALQEYMSDINQSIDRSSIRGLSTDEYDLLNEKLKANNVEFTYGQIDRVARETWVHYRAEVMIDGEWVTADGTTVSGNYATGDYAVATWYEAYNNILLYAPTVLVNDVLNVEALVELLSYLPNEGYEGITDDAGNEHRAASFKDLVRGDGLIPYFDDIDKIAEFLNLPKDQAEDILDDGFEIAAIYEQATGEKFSIIADFLVYGDAEDVEGEYYVENYNALCGGNLTIELYNQAIK